MTAVWNDQIISEAALDTRVSAARRAIGDTGTEQRLIRTLRTRGYRFIGWARREPSGRYTSYDTNGSTERTIPLDYPSIAVLPFDNFGAGPAQKHFADGVAQDLIAGLSKIGWLSVATSTASFSCKRERLHDAQIARYLLTGCVRKAAGHMRVSVQLADAIAQRQIWADSFDQGDVRGFAINNQICAQVITAIKPQLITGEHLRVQTKDEANLNDWECRIRALALMNTRIERTSRQSRF